MSFIHSVTIFWISTLSSDMINSADWKTFCGMEEGARKSSKNVEKIQMEQGDGEDMMIIGDIQELVPTNLALIGFQRKVKMSKKSRMLLLLFLLEDDAFLENKNTDEKQVLSQDDISCPGHEFEVPVEYPSTDLDTLFWNGE